GPLGRRADGSRIRGESVPIDGPGVATPGPLLLVRHVATPSFRRAAWRSMSRRISATCSTASGGKILRVPATALGLMARVLMAYWTRWIGSRSSRAMAPMVRAALCGLMERFPTWAALLAATRVAVASGLTYAGRS